MIISELGPSPPIPSDTLFLKVKGLRPFMKNVNIVVLVFERIETNWTKDNHSVHVLRVADETGSCLLTLFDAQGAAAKPGDILRILCGFVTLFKRTIRLACKVGRVTRIGKIRMVAHLEPDVSKIIWEGGDGDDPNKTIRPIIPPDDPKLQELFKELP